MTVLIIIIPKLGLKKLTDDELDGYVQDKIDALTDNANFPVTDPKLSDYALVLADYQKKLSAAKDGRKEDTIAKNTSRTKMEEQTTLLAYDVAKRSGGDLDKYSTSHFDYRKSGGPVPALDVPQNFKLSFTKYEGELKAGCKKVKSATSYEFRATLDATKAVKDWEVVITATKTRVILPNLESGKRYYSKVRAIGAKGKISDWSDQADKICP